MKAAICVKSPFSHNALFGFIGELLNVSFDVQDFFVQVTVVIHVKSTLSSPDPRVHMRIQNEIKPIDFSLWCVCPATSVDRPAATAQAASLTP